jgi:hypothetical protein
MPEGGSVKETKNRQKFLKENVDNKSTAQYTFPPFPENFYNTGVELVGNKLPLSPGHNLLHDWLADTSDTSSEKKLDADYEKLGEAHTFVLDNRVPILKFIINQQPENYALKSGGRVATSRDYNWYACPGCTYQTSRLGELVAHLVLVLEHQSVCSQDEPPFIFQLGKCTKYVWQKNQYQVEKKMKKADCHQCPEGLTALDGLGKGLHATLNPGAFQHIGENKPLMKLFYYKAGFALSFRKIFESINEKGRESWWTDALANYAVARLYRRIFILKPRVHDLFLQKEITEARHFSRRIFEVEHLSHSQTKTLGTDYAFLDAWNNREDLASIRQDSLLRDIDDVLNPPKKDKKRTTKVKSSSTRRKGGV